ncbi:hypothetical protein L873DRAFT_1715992 [Choiromyces venosus 120613-1]|uniref:HTH psq-type domain-containing protein n=1 Tax=Choiromyces venosus 120613-1 TaxID=1336337 RepID=A0A3N4IY59_9PEZI|nr:hypothetical protein L873DRAFT_1715992 [Choiromyces venosus 120613-1]
MPESSSKIEDRILLTCKKLLESDRPNIAATVCEFDISKSCLQGRWKGCPAKSEQTPTNRKLMDDEELTVCLYLKHLDEIGTSARLSMISSYTNAIL